VVSLKAYFELLLLKTDHTPLVSARSCVAGSKLQYLPEWSHSVVERAPQASMPTTR